jgi:hypothetical protein
LAVGAAVYIKAFGDVDTANFTAGISMLQMLSSVMLAVFRQLRIKAELTLG